MFRCGNTMDLTTRFFVAKFTILTPLPLLSWCRLSFPIVALKISSLPSFALKSHNRIFVCYLGKWSETCCKAHKNCIWIITFLLTWCMRIQNNYITPATSQNYIWHPIIHKLSSLNCWYYSVVYKKSCSQLMIFISFSIEKKYNPLLLQLTRYPT